MRGLLALIAVAILALSLGGILGLQFGFWYGLCGAGVVTGLALFIDTMVKGK